MYLVCWWGMVVVGCIFCGVVFVFFCFLVCCRSRRSQVGLDPGSCRP